MEQDTLQRARNWFSRKGRLRWVAMGLMVGALTGVGTAAFFYLLKLAEYYTLNLGAGYYLPSPGGEELFPSHPSHSLVRWLFFLLPALGGLVSGILIYSLAPETEGHGTDAMIDAFHNRKGYIRGRTPFVKAAATIALLAGGGSGGREGPTIQIGGGIGSWLGRVLGLSARDTRHLVLAGVAGGLSAIFRAPLGGAITAIEVIYWEDLETGALIPAIISAFTSYIIFAGIYGFGSVFTILPVSFHEPQQLVFYAALGLICVPIGIFYIRTFHFFKDRVFKPMRVPNHVKPMIGGLALGVLGLFYPQVYSGGYGLIQQALNGQISPDIVKAIEIMAGLALFKIVATSFSVGSGGSAGLFGPTLAIGGMIGGVIGYSAHYFLPALVSLPDATAFVLVGMAAFFGGVAHAPLGAMILVTEMTGGYQLMEPLLLVTVLALIFNYRFSIYRRQRRDKFHSPAHVGDYTTDVLKDVKVADVYIRDENLEPLPARASFAEVEKRLHTDRAEVTPVINGEGDIIGLLSIDGSKPIDLDTQMTELLDAEDMTVPVESLNPEDSLDRALRLFLKHPVHGLLVTDRQDPNKILGYLSHHDLNQAYNREIIRRKCADGDCEAGPDIMPLDS